MLLDKIERDTSMSKYTHTHANKLFKMPLFNVKQQQWQNENRNRENTSSLTGRPIEGPSD